MKQRFSTFLFISLLVFIAIILTVITGTVYNSLNSSMQQEFFNQAEAREAEISAFFIGRMNAVEQALRHLSQDNDIKQFFLKKQKDQIHRYFIQYTLFNGMSFFAKLSAERDFFIKFPETLKNIQYYFVKFEEHPAYQSQLFMETANGSLVCLFFIPVAIEGVIVGEIAAVYNLAADANFWKVLKIQPNESIYVIKPLKLINLQNPAAVQGLSLKSQELFLEALQKKNYANLYNSLFVPVTSYPDLLFVKDTDILQVKKNKLRLNLVYLCAVIFLLTIVLALVIKKGVSGSLMNLVNQADTISRDPTHQFIDADNIPYLEFQNLAASFNRMLISLYHTQEKERKVYHFLDTIVKTIGDPLFVKDNQHRYIIVNKAFCLFFGKERDEVLNKTDYALLPKAKADHFWEEDLKVFKTGVSVLYEDEYYQADGKIRNLYINKSFFSDPETKEKYIVGLIHDITQLKLIEQQLAERRDNLALLVEERTTELQESNSQLLKEIQDRKEVQLQLERAKKMEAIGLLASGVAHDLNNILSGLVSYPDLILMNLDENNPLRRQILFIQNSGKRAAAIVQDLLTLARRSVSVMSAVDLKKTITDYFQSPEFERLTSQYPGVNIETDLNQNKLKVFGSPFHLAKIVMNLVTNAIEAIKEKGEISVRLEDQYLDNTFCGYENIPEGEYIVLTVIDNGQGINPDDIDKIFEPFYTKKVMGKSGTGLGMTVVWNSVKDHNGFINIESSLGKGTKIGIFFPVTRVIQQDIKQKINWNEMQGHNELILVVDDREEQLEIAQAMLEKLGYQVRTASSGEEAVSYFQNNHADLVILDMIMEPGIDGYETFRQIKELQPDQKAIITSGYSEVTKIKLAHGIGVGSYLKKPYLFGELAEIVHSELNKKP